MNTTIIIGLIFGVSQLVCASDLAKRQPGYLSGMKRGGQVVLQKIKSGAKKADRFFEDKVLSQSLLPRNRSEYKRVMKACDEDLKACQDKGIWEGLRPDVRLTCTDDRYDAFLRTRYRRWVGGNEAFDPATNLALYRATKKMLFGASKKQVDSAAGLPCRRIYLVFNGYCR